MTLPPSLDGAVYVTVALALPRLAVPIVGAPDTVAAASDALGFTCAMELIFDRPVTFFGCVSCAGCEKTLVTLISSTLTTQASTSVVLSMRTTFVESAATSKLSLLVKLEKLSPG